MTYTDICKQMQKNASTLSDIAIGTVPNTVIGVLPGGDMLNTVAHIGGAIADDPTDTELREMNDSKALALIPGVANYRVTNRQKGQLREDNGGHKRLWSQAIGPSTSAALAAGLGAVIGGTIDRERGVTAGLLVGAGTAGVASILAGILAAVRRRRTQEEQKEYANSGIAQGAAEYLIPGVAAYNTFKTTGAAMGKDRELKLEDEARRQKLLERVTGNAELSYRDLKDLGKL